MATCNERSMICGPVMAVASQIRVNKPLTHYLPLQHHILLNISIFLFNLPFHPVSDVDGSSLYSVANFSTQLPGDPT